MEGIKFAIYLVLILLIGYLLYYYYTRIYQLEPVTSRHDKLHYNVHSAFENKQEAADTMAELNKRGVKLMKYMKKKYGISSVGDHEVNIATAATQRLLQRYNPDVLAENHPAYVKKTETSYTVNKGEALHMCLRDGRNMDLIHGINLLTFVYLHELSHVTAKEYGHGLGFWQTFKAILRDAVEAGVYKPVDYEKNVMPYCGIDVSYNPLLDKSLSPAF